MPRACQHSWQHVYGYGAGAGVAARGRLGRGRGARGECRGLPAEGWQSGDDGYKGGRRCYAGVRGLGGEHVRQVRLPLLFAVFVCVCVFVFC